MAKGIVLKFLTALVLIAVSGVYSRNAQAAEDSYWVKESLKIYEKYCAGSILSDYIPGSAFNGKINPFSNYELMSRSYVFSSNLYGGSFLFHENYWFYWYLNEYKYGIYSPIYKYSSLMPPICWGYMLDNFEQTSQPVRGLFRNSSDMLLLGGSYDYRSVFSNIVYRKELVEGIFDWLGTPYSWGGHSKEGVDCSNFMSCLLEQSIDMKIPAGSSYQAELFMRIDDFDDLQFGDMLFFTGSNVKSYEIGHVGIYLGNGVFAHSSSFKRRGVIMSHIDMANYKVRFRFGGRILRYHLNKFGLV